MVPMQPERRSLSTCLAQILSGEHHTVSFDHLVPLHHTSAEALAEALRPWLQRLQAGDIEDVHKVWPSLEKNISLLCDFTMGNWNDLEDQILAAMREALAPRSNALVDQQFLRLQAFRRDPFSSSTAMKSSRFSEILSEFPEWKERVENFFQESQDRYKADCNRTLEVAAKGAQFVEVWANRLAFSIEIESVIDQHCPNPRSFASTCAQIWLQYSLPVLPWILFWLLLPAMNGGTNAAMTNLGKVRKALERCDSADAMVQLRDAFVNACSLLLRTAWCHGRSDYAQAVSWLSSALVVTHDACQILLPDLPASAVAAALAAIPLDVRPQSPWETQPVEFADFVAPKMEELSQALAQAVHEEVKHWQAEGGQCGPCDDGPWWPGKMASLLLLFRLLPDAGGAPIQAQARLVALRAVQAGEEAKELERRLLSFLQNECGYQHPTLRHLAKVLQATLDGETLGSNFSAVAIPAVAACNLGLSDAQIDLNGDAGQSSGLSVLEHFPQLSASSASKVICNQQVEWAERYFVRYPHRRLLWTTLGAVELLWKHQKGQTLLITTERQAHFLLALDASDDLVLPALEPMELELQPLDSSDLSVLQRDNGRWRIRSHGPVAERLDLRVVPRAKAEAQELGARSREAHTAPVVDAALVRILKRFHVLTGEEILQKLSNYPESLEVKLEQGPFVAFSDARAAAQDGGREDRGLLRAETEVTGDFLKRRFFYET